MPTLQERDESAKQKMRRMWELGGMSELVDLINFGLAKKAAAGTLTVILVLLCLDYYHAIQLYKVPIPHLVLGLWVYVILNGAAASMFHFFKENGKTCPKCGIKLKTRTSLRCKKCGVLKFRKKRKKKSKM